MPHPHKPVLALTWRTSGFYIGVVKWRNQLLALFCLFVFAAFGVLYFRYWVVQKPFGIILFIGEGLSADRLAAARIFAATADTPLTLDSLSQTALLKNYSNDFATPDSAAAATAIATGVKVNNGSLGIDPDGNTLANLIELARASGRTTGLVTDSSLTSATAAAFYAHTLAPSDWQDLARTLVEHAQIDLVLGGGSVDFLPESAGGRRLDGRNLLKEAKAAGYDVVRTRTELEAVAWWRWPKVFGVFGPAELAHGDEVGPETQQPSLSDMVRRGIELLQIHRGGYLLVVDAGLIRRAAERNDAEGTLAAIVELDRAISVALRYAGAKATVFVCGDVAIGGLTLNGFPPRTADRSHLLGGDSLGQTQLTWATGPNRMKTPDVTDAAATAGEVARDAAPAAAPLAPPHASPEEKSASPEPDVLPEQAVDATLADEAMPEPVVTASVPTNSPIPKPPEAPAAVYVPAAVNTVEDVIAFGNGPGSETLHGVMESTAIFDIISENL